MKGKHDVCESYFIKNLCKFSKKYFVTSGRSGEDPGIFVGGGANIQIFQIFPETA